MTQALALAGFLRAAGHRVDRVLLGTSPFRSVPEYFLSGIHAAVETFSAPTLVPDRLGRGASTPGTLTDVLRRSPSFLRSIRKIRAATAGADVVVNFLDLMGGLSRLVLPTRVPSVAVAHNYVFLHPALGRLPGPGTTRRLVLGYVRATTVGSSRRIALSFGPLPGTAPNGLDVAPPLLRPRLLDLSARNDGHLLAYALNPGYGALLADWQRRHPEVRVHCYLDGGATALPGEPPPGFQVHALNDEAFLVHLAGCRAYVGSAGFESICEAHWLGKAVLAVPTAGHYEQTLNAWDAERVGAARAGGYDDLDRFWSSPPVPSGAAVRDFRAWVALAPRVIVDLIEQAASRSR